MIKLLGLGAGMLQITCKIPQIIKILKTKDTKAISLLMYACMTLSFILWFIYSIIIKDLPLFLTYLINIFLVGTILILKINDKILCIKSKTANKQNEES